VTDDLITWLRAQLDEDERWAMAASQTYRYADEGSVAPAGGVHWRWVAGENWDTVRPDPAVMEFVEGQDGSWVANLATVEEWPSTMRIDAENSRTRMMPRVYANGIVEMDASAAGHIIRHDPARVLAEVDAKRRILARHEQCGTGHGYCDDGGHGWRLDDGTPVCGDKLDLTRPYADRPGYRSEWAP
jgi:hypothetical protein